MISGEYTIRKAKLSDAKGLAELYLQFWVTHKGCDPLLQFKKKVNLNTQIEAAKSDMSKKDTYVLVAVKDNKIIGFIEFLIKKNHDCFNIEKYGYLNSAVTHKDFRGKGVARALTSACIKSIKSKGIGYIKTNVYNTNKIALKTWNKLGFRSISTMMMKKL